MKNIKVLYEPEEIRSYFREHFKTQLFRDEMEKPGSFIYNIVDQAAKYPLFLYEFSDHPSKDTQDKDKTEWAHFGSWFGGITVRDYENPGINDAYYLHELYHKGYMSYRPEATFEGWKDKIIRNELNASVASELELYFHHPEFRAQTFKQEIFADRFLNNAHFMKRWKEDTWAMRDEVRLDRKELMHRENKDNPVDYWIHKFAQQNEAWAAIWSRRYPQVEAHMKALHDAIDHGVSRKKAMDECMAWMTSQEVTHGTEIPFPDEAEAFAGVYRLNNRHYMESISRGDMPKDTTNNVVDTIKAAYGKDFNQPLSRDLEQVNPLPQWSDRLGTGKGYHILQGTGAYGGAFIWHYAIKPSRIKDTAPRAEDIDIFLQERGDTGPNGEKRYGTFGGHISYENKEQPRNGAIRENNEELADDTGTPLLNLQPKELNFVNEGTDYRDMNRPLSYFGYSRQLSPREYLQTLGHVERMRTDPVYAEAAREATHGEVKNVQCMTLGEALALPEASFTHPHEREALHQIAHELLQQPQKQYTYTR